MTVEEIQQSKKQAEKDIQKILNDLQNKVNLRVNKVDIYIGSEYRTHIKLNNPFEY